MVESEFVLGCFKAVLNRPAMAFDGNERLNASPRWAPCREEGEITVADIAADEETAGPKPRLRFVIFVGTEVSEFTIGPVVKSCALCALAGREPLPGVRGKIASDLLRFSGHHGLANPRAKVVVGFDPKDIAFASAT